jgi:hypothetical protein
MKINKSRLQRIVQEEIQSILAEQRTKGLSIGDEELRFAQVAQYRLDNAIKAYNYWGDRDPQSKEFKNAASAVSQFRDELRDLGVNPGSVTGQQIPGAWWTEDPRHQGLQTPGFPDTGTGPTVILDREDFDHEIHLGGIDNTGGREFYENKSKLQKIIQEELQKILQEFDFGDRRAIGQRSEQLFEPLPADEMDDLMNIVHGPRRSGTIYDQERLIGVLDNKLESGDISAEEHDFMRSKALWEPEHLWPDEPDTSFY